MALGPKEKILRLTEVQEVALSQYRDWWVKRAIRSYWDQALAVRAVQACYRVAGVRTPIVWWWQSPLQAHFGMYIVGIRGQVKGQVGDQVRAQVRVQVGAQVWAQVRAQVGDQVRDQVRDQVGDQVRDQVRDQVWDQVRDQVRAQVRAQVRDQVGDQVWDQVGDQVWDQVRDQVRAQVGDQVRGWISPHDGAGWCAWRAFFNFFWREFHIGRQLVPHYYLDCSGAFWWWWFDGLAHLCAPPQKMYFDQTNPYRFHRDGGAAIEWPDGFALYFLHGVAVPEWLACKPFVDIDPSEFAKIENAEVRREFIRKVGIERIANRCKAKQLDQRDGYELLSINLGGQTGDWPYLKMQNPSIGCWHLECVARECRTVPQALAWRNQTKDQPEVLT